MKTAVHILAVILFCVSWLCAQDSAGVSSFSSSASTPGGVVDLSNLNRSIAIPVVDKSGRGVPFSFSLVNNSSIYTILNRACVDTETCAHPKIFYIAPTITCLGCGFQPDFGWMDSVGGAGGGVGGDQVACPTNTNETNTINLRFTDPSGAVHPLPASAMVSTNPSCGPNHVSGYATDQSGYFISFSNSGTSFAQDRSGNTVSNGGPLVTDRNGNTLTTGFDNVGITYTDTFGVKALTVAIDSSSKTYTYPGPNGTSISLVVNYKGYPRVASGFGCSDILEYNSQFTVLGNGPILLVDNITLADGTKYTFQYEPTPAGSPYFVAGAVTGRIASMTLPTGGTISYSYPGPNGGINCTDGTTMALTVTTPDGATAYTRSISGATSTTTITDAQGSQTVAVFQPLTNPQNPIPPSSNVQPRIETQRKIYQGSAQGTPLETLTTCYNGNCSATTVSLPLTQISHLVQLADGTQRRSDAFLDPTSGLTTETDEYDFGNNQPGPLLRKDLTSYATLSNNILDRPQRVIVCAPGGSDSDCNGSGTKVSLTSFGYDETSLASSGDTQHVAITGSRGNLTSVHRWLNPGNTTVDTKYTYDDAGNVLTVTDPLSHQTSFVYGDCNGGFVTKTVLPDTGSAPVHHVTLSSHDCNTGLQLSSTDQNGNVTNYTYDAMLRPLTITLPADGSGSTPKTTFAYPDANTVKVQKSITASVSDSVTGVSDGLGRTIHVLHSTPGGTVKSDATYDALGRLSTASNPYFSTNDATYGVVQKQYDALGRVTQATEQDGSVSSVSYSGNCSTSTDEAGKKRRSCLDALGRLTNVWEDPGGLNYETDYQYDALGNLLRIDEKGSAPSDSTQWRTRWMVYDSLSRMLKVHHPESGTITYFYDGNGNVLQEVLPSPNQNGTAQHTISSCYDELNRATGKAYSWQECQNGQVPQGTAAVTYTYDTYAGSTLGSSIGRLVRTGQPSTGGHYFTYDALGRVISTWLCLPSDCTHGASVNAQYDLAGNLTQLTYPDGRVVAYSYNSASQLNNVQFTQWNGAAVSPYSYYSVADSNFYPNGAPKSVNFGNGIVESYQFNTRLLPRENTVATILSGNTVTFADHVYNYTSPALTGNNGNILSVTDNLNSALTQSFSYDPLNRLATAGEGRWGLNFGYDSWNNFLQQTVTAGSAFAHTHLVNANNQFTDMTYDAAGNTLNDGFHSYTYDPENRIMQVDGSGATYTYGGDGVRLRKDVGTNFIEYVYFGSNVIAEHDQSGCWTDYIFAGGTRIAKADCARSEINLQGTNTAAGQYTWWQIGGAPQVTVSTGDKLYILQNQQGSAVGGIILTFQDGGNSSWGAQDQVGYYTNADRQLAGWHTRIVDLTVYAGKTINGFQVGNSSAAATGPWNIQYAEIVVVKKDGTVYPIFNGQSSVSFVSTGNSTPGVTGLVSTIITDSTVAGNPLLAQQYYHSDQIGSSRLITGSGVWPVWQGTFLPFGDEYNPQTTTNHYKFTGLEHDAESNLEHAQFRQLSAAQGRWISPDPYGGSMDVANPQSLNRYAYVGNNPVNIADPSGLDWNPSQNYSSNFEGLTYGLEGDDYNDLNALIPCTECYKQVDGKIHGRDTTIDVYAWDDPTLHVFPDFFHTTPAPSFIRLPLFPGLHISAGETCAMKCREKPPTPHQFTVNPDGKKEKQAFCREQARHVAEASLLPGASTAWNSSAMTALNGGKPFIDERIFPDEDSAIATAAKHTAAEGVNSVGEKFAPALEHNANAMAKGGWSAGGSTYYYGGDKIGSTVAKGSASIFKRLGTAVELLDASATYSKAFDTCMKY